MKVLYSLQPIPISPFSLLFCRFFSSFNPNLLMSTAYYQTDLYQEQVEKVIYELQLVKGGGWLMRIGGMPSLRISLSLSLYI
ncbi:hypothetical protein Hanom_Chr10g00922131 [Helianthus anomalus]